MNGIKSYYLIIEQNNHVEIKTVSKQKKSSLKDFFNFINKIDLNEYSIINKDFMVKWSEIKERIAHKKSGIFRLVFELFYSITGRNYYIKKIDEKINLLESNLNKKLPDNEIQTQEFKSRFNNVPHVFNSEVEAKEHLNKLPKEIPEYALWIDNENTHSFHLLLNFNNHTHLLTLVSEDCWKLEEFDSSNKICDEKIYENCSVSKLINIIYMGKGMSIKEEYIY
jgi:hypothetical protein